MEIPGLRSRIVLGALAGLLLASSAAAAESLRIAVVDQQRALNSSREGRAAEKILKSLAEKKRTELEPAGRLKLDISSSSSILTGTRPGRPRPCASKVPLAWTAPRLITGRTVAILPENTRPGIAGNMASASAPTSNRRNEFCRNEATNSVESV